MVKEEAEEDGAREDVEDTVPDHLRSGRDDIAALRESPCNGVGDQHERQVSGALQVARAEHAAASEVSSGAVREEDVPFKTSQRVSP